MDHVRASIGSWSVSSGWRPTPDAFGCYWTLTGLDGWFGAVPVRASLVDRQSADGAHRGRPYFGARPVVLAGTVTAPDRGGLEDALDRLAVVLADDDDREGTLVVDQIAAGLSRQAACILDGGQAKTDRLSATSAAFELAVVCPDPLRLSTAVRSVTLTPYRGGGGRSYPLRHPRTYGSAGSAGRATLVTAGPVRAWPVVTIAGYANQPRLVKPATGEVLFYAQEVFETADPIVIDTRAGEVWQGDAGRAYYLTPDSTFWGIDPGGSDEVLFVVDGGDEQAVATIEWRDTWP